MPTPPSRQNLFLALAIVSLVVVEGFVIVGARLAGEAVDLHKRTLNSIIAISEVNERKDHTESLVREFVVTGGEPFALRAEKNKLEIHERVTYARQFMGDEADQVRRLDRLDATLKELTGRWGTVLATRRTQGRDPAERLVSDGIGRRLTDEAEVILEEMKAEEDRLLAERSGRAARLSGYTKAASQVGGVMTVFFGFLAWRTLRGAQAKLEQRVQERMHELQQANENLRTAIAGCRNGVNSEVL